MAQLRQICLQYPTMLHVLKRIRPRDPKGNRLYKQLQGLARGGKPLAEVFSKTILTHISVVKGSFMVYREPHMAPRVYKHRAEAQERIRQRKILEKEASTVIESVWRMYAARSLLVKQKAAATLIENFRRCVNARRETQRRRVAARKLLEYNSATLIQATRRGAAGAVELQAVQGCAAFPGAVPWSRPVRVVQTLHRRTPHTGSLPRTQRIHVVQTVQGCRDDPGLLPGPRGVPEVQAIQSGKDNTSTLYRGHVQFQWYKRYQAAQTTQARFRGVQNQETLCATQAGCNPH